MPNYKVPLPATTRKLRFVLDHQSSTDDLLVTFSRGDKVIGQVRMSWSDWPFQEHLLSGGTLGKIVDILADLEEQSMEREKQLAEEDERV